MLRYNCLSCRLLVKRRRLIACCLDLLKHKLLRLLQSLLNRTNSFPLYHFPHLLAIERFIFTESFRELERDEAVSTYD